MRAHGLLPHDAGEGPRLGGARVGEHLGAEPEYPHVVPRLNLRGPEVGAKLVLVYEYAVLMCLSLFNSGYKQLNQGLMPIQTEFCNPPYHGRAG